MPIALVRLFATACVALLFAGCARQGDFGRPKENALSAFVSPVLGPTMSSVPFTDDEEEMRARSWRFLMPARERTIFDRLIYDMARVGFIEADYFPETLTWYRDALLYDSARSPASRFARIANDTAEDRALIVTFSAAAARVLDADRMRRAAMAQIRSLDGPEIGDAKIRMQENRALVAWVCNRMAMRIGSYRYALEHLFVAMPQEDAVKAERQVILLENDFSVLRATGCVRPDPFRGIPIDRGLRIPVDGKFYFEDVLAGPRAPVRTAPAAPVVIRKG